MNETGFPTARCNIPDCIAFGEIVSINHKHVYIKSDINVKDHDPVNHPKHYTGHPSGIECIEITRHMNFNLGNAVKYIWRVDDKGDPIENLEKAIFYIKDEIERRRAANV